MLEQWVWPPTPTEWVAGATIALAAVTAWLAVTTRRMANAARQEVAAQWRPALIPVRTEERLGSITKLGGEFAPIEVYEGKLQVAIYNAGSGPAPTVNAALSRQRPPGPRLESLPLEDAQVILPGQQRSLEFAIAPADMDGTMVVTFRDLAAVRFEASMTIHLRQQDGEGAIGEGRVLSADEQRRYWFDDYVGRQLR